MNRLPIVFALLLAALPLRAAESETLSERTLKQIVERQKTLLADAAKQGEKLDEEAFRAQVQSVVHDYERLLAASPQFAAAYASYGLLLGKVGMKKESVAMLLKANQLDSDIPLVKNQLGNHLAEEGRPLEAAPITWRRSSSSPTNRFITTSWARCSRWRGMISSRAANGRGPPSTRRCTAPFSGRRSSPRTGSNSPTAMRSLFTTWKIRIGRRPSRSGPKWRKRRRPLLSVRRCGCMPRTSC
jgi:hypothetical protein